MLKVGDKITSVSLIYRAVFRAIVVDLDVKRPSSHSDEGEGPWFSWMSPGGQHVPEAYSDEGIEWARGWDGPEVDALLTAMGLRA